MKCRVVSLLLLFGTARCSGLGGTGDTDDAAGTVLPPTNVQAPATSTSGSIPVTWRASETSGVTSYEVAQSTDHDNFTVVWTGSGLGTTIRIPQQITIDLRVRACTSDACSAWTPQISITVTPRFPDYLGNVCETTRHSAPAQENVGAIAAEATTAGGTASYRIPITIAPGRRGAAPSVALVYGSSGGDGHAGMGWSLAAASQITRCARTAAQDGENEVVSFSERDRFCLSGERLLLVAGVYGRSGSEYRTEIDGFARVKLNGDALQASSSFTVEAKNGAITYYGAAFGDPNAVEIPAGTSTPLAWWIRRSEDRQGNAVLHQYTTIDGEFLLSAIDYSGVRAAPGDRHVRFEYEARPDVTTHYHRGTSRKTSQRLEAITTDVAGDIVRRYELAYVQSRATERSLLSTVTECTSNPCRTETSLRPTRFQYQDDPPSWVTEEHANGSGSDVSIRLASDYDGDGTRDWVEHRTEEPWGGRTVKSELHLSGGGAIDLLNGPWDDGFDRVLRDFGSWHTDDVDLDGRADMIGARGGYVVLRSLAGERATNLAIGDDWLSHTADFDGNGRTDFLVWIRNGPDQLHLQCAPLADGTLNFCNHVAFPEVEQGLNIAGLDDFDGDGLPDVLVTWDRYTNRPREPRPQVIFTRIASGNISFAPVDIELIGGPAGNPSTRRAEKYLDVNGDGLTDIFAPPSSLWINHGGAFQSASVSGSIVPATRFYDDIVAADFNADGKSELLVPGEIRSGFCAMTAGDEPLEYCSTAGANLHFGLSGSPHEMDFGIYQWDAFEFVEDASGGFTIEQHATTMEAATGRARIDDYFGDGLVDFGFRVEDAYRSDPPRHPTIGYYDSNISHGHRVSRNIGPVPDLLIRAQDGLDIVAAWEYRPLSSGGSTACASPRAIPFYRANFSSAPDGEHFFFASSMNVVARFEQSSGLGDTNTRCYRYEDAMANNRGRGFLGFRKIIEEEALPDVTNNLRTTTVFRQQFPLVSAVEQVSVALASNAIDAAPLRETRNRWTSRCIDDADSTTPAQICFNYVDREISTTRDLGTRAWVSTATTTRRLDGVDLEYGNVTFEEVRSEDTTGRHVARVEQKFDYASAGNWWIERLAEKTVTTDSVVFSVPPTMTPTAYPENSRKQVKVEIAYYAETHPAYARLPSSQTTQAGAPGQWMRTTFDRYDVYGNLELKTLTAADVRDPRAIAMQATPDGYFMALERNALQHERHFVVDPKTGEVTSEVDANSLASARTLDDFGRVLSTTPAGKPTIERREVWCTDQAECGTRYKSKVITTGNALPRTIQYLDQLGRVLKETRTAFDGTTEISAFQEYDRRGYLVRSSEPSTGATGAFFTDYQGIDALGRPARKIVSKAGYTDRAGRPDETFVTDYAYAGLTTNITLDGRLHASRTYNSRKELVETIDAKGGRTRYRHDGQGHLILIEDSQGNQFRATYDHSGRKISETDPDRGTWSFTYNGLSELISQRDARNVVVEFERDRIGRVIRRMVNRAGDATWSYDVAGKGRLDFESKLDRASGRTIFTRRFSYDPLLRPTKTTIEFDGLSYEVEQAHDCHGQVIGVEYPNGEAVEYEYTREGYLRLEKNPLALRTPEIYREILALTARNQVELERFGNGLYGKYRYFESTGQIRGKCVGIDAACTDPRQDLEYDYQDPFGNLTRQVKRIHDSASPEREIREEFVYDALHRLDLATRTWTGGGHARVAVDYEYDAIGNITVKSDHAASYAYGSSGRNNVAHAGPHAVVALQRNGVAVEDFRYDDNGNMIAGEGRTVAYGAFNKPHTITESGVVTNFSYDANDDRYKQESPGRTVRYVERVYEEDLTSGAIEEKAFVGSSVVITKSGSRRTVAWLHADRLGSTDTVTGVAGAVIESHGFDAFGMPRTSRWLDRGGELHSGEWTSEATTRGFTGHEHLDQHRLIHMNGRAYDPALGRFLSVDPIVSDAANSQSLNPYSYVLNNPLSAKDPTGFLRDDAWEVYVRRFGASPPSESVYRFRRYDIIVTTFTNKESGLVVTQTIDTWNGTETWSINGAAVDPSSIGGPAQSQISAHQARADLLIKAAHDRKMWDAGRPPGEDTKEALAAHGAIMMAPVMLIVGAIALDGAALMSQELLAQLGAAGPAIYAAGTNLASALVDGPQLAPAGAGMRVLGGAAAECFDDAARARPMLSEALEQAGGKAAIVVEDLGEGFKMFTASTNKGEVRVLAESIREGAKLVLRGVEIEGPGAGTFGLRQLRELARELGRQEGVQKIVVEGAKRTTGANRGHVPRTLEFNID